MGMLQREAKAVDTVRLVQLNKGYWVLIGKKHPPQKPSSSVLSQFPMVNLYFVLSYCCKIEPLSASHLT